MIPYLITIGLIVTIVLILFLSDFYKKLFWKKFLKDSILEKEVYQILVPRDNSYGNLQYERFLITLYNLCSNKKSKSEKINQPIFSFEIFCTFENIIFCLVSSKKYSEFILGQLYSEFPDIQVQKIETNNYLEVIGKNKNIIFSLKKQKDNYLPINTVDQLGKNAIGSIIAVLSNLNQQEYSLVQIIIQPNLDFNELNATQKKLESKDDVSESPEKQNKEENKKQEIQKKVFFNTQIRIMISTSNEERSSKIAGDVVQSFKQYNNESMGNVLTRENYKQSTFVKILNSIPSLTMQKKILVDPLTFVDYRKLESDKRSIMSNIEVSSLYYFPNQNITSPNIVWLRSRKIPFPLNLPIYDPNKGKDNPRIFAMTDYRDIHKIFGIKKMDRRRHFYLLGKSGTGKSTLLKNMILGDIYFGEGVGVLDPHGDLIDDIIEHIPSHRKEDVIIIDPSDTEYPVGLNMLDVKEDETIELLADGIVSVFKKFFADSWGPRLQYMLMNTILTLLHCQNLSLVAVPRILMDTNYRKFLLKQVKDSFLLKYWQEEYVKMAENQKILSEAISPILNKVGRFLNSSTIRNMMGQVKSTVDLSEAMNNGKILLINLSQGKIGEESSSLLGGMLVTRLYSNAMQRAKIPESERRDFYLYVDEFQNFANDSFAKILSEARKYGLALILTHQYLDQLDENLRSAIFGNVGTLMNYVVSSKDAEVFEKEYYPYLTANDLVHLDKYHLALKMTIDGQQSKPFTAIALKPFFKKVGLGAEIRDISRKKYSKSREEIEFKLSKWLNSKYDSNGNLIQEKQLQNSNFTDVSKKEETNYSVDKQDKPKDSFRQSHSKDEKNFQNQNTVNRNHSNKRK